MAYYYGYAVKMNDLVKKYIRDYRAAQSKVDEAVKEYDAFKERQRTGLLTEYERYLGDSADNVKGGILKATKAEFQHFRNERFNVLRMAESIRDDLAAQVDEDFAVKPEKVNQNTMTLLSSGICKPSELCRLANEAIENGNPTMARVIGSHIDKVLADDRKNVNRLNVSDKSQLISTMERVKACDGHVYVDRFNGLIDILRYLTGDPKSEGLHYNENPAMFDRWDELTGDMIENGFND